MSVNKRIFDIVVVLLASPIWVPAILITALAVLLTSGWPVFYSSRRYVLKDTYRTVFKFRTMVRNAVEIANRDTIKAEPGKVLNIVIDNRLYTTIGRFLERIHFTELPQLLQVLTGTLTLVGNRPMPENMLHAARELYPYVEERFSIPCGVTGPAQIAGRHKLTDVERLRLEITYAYICRYAFSPLLDLHLLSITLFTPFGFYKHPTVDTVNARLMSYVRGDEKKNQIIQLVEALMPAVDADTE